ncbi:hypothetical protein GGQ80_001911 [Sphingomonas jinjuensis]|uniref:Uncharacterized protein n=1 Tax=Sphingomonas jinjuensis TaxID=535907 RepID=A0A840FBF4_9SPHN|nr:hypothetical protein [Sphingomonas jinjuensis]MBB4154001.1 hypothetical protein [Sphingomonas jinjuensis]
MRRLLMLAGVAALALTGPALSQGKGKGDGPGGGGGHGRGGGGPGKGGDRGPGPGGPPGQRDRGPGDRGGPGAERGPDRGPGERFAGGPDRGPRDEGPGRGKGRGPKGDRGPDRADRQGPGPRGDRPRDWEVARAQPGPGPRGDRQREWREVRGPDGPDRARDDRGRGPRGGRDLGWRGYDERVPASRFASRRWDGDGYRWADRSYGFIAADACPPGLARRGNGCLPPGQARRLDPARGWADWYPARYQDDRYDWRYDDGYLYGVDRGGDGLFGGGGGGLLAAIIPLLGGALAGGNLWPQQATDHQVPDYYDRFYGDNGGGTRYDYRYADDAVFAVDPQSQRIDSIAGLLTGDDWSIGQRMPAGYDLYNIPPQYRSRYADSSEAMYRYSDGYVYRMDPRTRIVRSVSELLG